MAFSAAEIDALYRLESRSQVISNLSYVLDNWQAQYGFIRRKTAIPTEWHQLTFAWEWE